MSFNFELDDDFFSFGSKPNKKEAPKKEKTEQKKAGKADGKSASGKGNASNSAGDCEVSLPVTVYGRNFAEKIGESGTLKLSALCDQLIEKGYDQLKLSNMSLFYIKDTNAVYVSDVLVKGSAKEGQAFHSKEAKLTVSDGLLKCELCADDFPDKEFDEITILDVTQRWCAVNAQYTGCELYVDQDTGNCYPVLLQDVSRIEQDNMTVYVNGSATEVELEGVETMNALASKLAGVLGGAKAYICKSDENYFLSYDAGKEKKYCKNSKVAVQKTKEVEKKYPLPLTLYIVTWNATYELTPEMFGGKEKVTKQEISDVMAKHEKMFADKSRKVDYLYSEERHTMSCMFISGKKGAGAYASCEDLYDSPVHTGMVKLIRSVKELEAVKKLDMYMGTYCEPPMRFRINALPHGNFIGHLGSDVECCTIKRVEWERKLPKMGREVLDGIVQYFKSQLPMEAAVRILYNRNTGEFFTVAAQGKTDRWKIEYDYTNAIPLMMMDGVIQVCEIHSHNSMPAFFSKQDDSDELYCGVYGVIGELDKDVPSVKFRAGMDGVFADIPVEELFE